MPPHNVPLYRGTARIALEWDASNRFSFTTYLEPGLYTIGLQADLKEFDWERLYYPMTKYNNSGQRTGPWDFDLYNNNQPLLPTWKIRRDGRYVGLWYMQRPTAEDLEEKTLRAEFGIYVDTPGEVEFVGEPFNEFTMRPIAMYLEENAFDQFEPQPWAEGGLEANWAHHVSEGIGWDALRKKVLGTEWESFLRQATRAYTEHYGVVKNSAGIKTRVPADAIGVLVFSYRILGEDAMLEKVLSFVRHYLEQPAWGNPDPYGYGHNGDMGCALIIKHLTLAYNWLAEELGDLREPLLSRLEKQLEIFFEQQLLMAQYWGGATLQDHGFRSSPSVGFAAINLLGHSKVAEKTLAFYIPRFYRTLEKLPRDGFIPFSQYHKIQLYVNDMTDFRIAYKYASGRDIFAESTAYQNVPQYILSCLDEASMNTHVCTTRGDRKDFLVGLPFFFSLAKDYSCDRSRYLANVLMKHYRSKDFDLYDRESSPTEDTRYVWKALETLPMAILKHDEGVFSDARPEVHALTHYPDGGAIQYRDEPNRFNVAVTCFCNTASFHAVGTDLSGTDMGINNPSVGNFSVAVGREPLLQCAESGYRTGTQLGNVPMIDGKGQYGDCNYTMGVPMRTWRGQRIQKVLQRPDGVRGFARLNLQPAYPDEMEVLTYTRDFFFEPACLRVRDTVITRVPHAFRYWFHTWERHEIASLKDGTYRIAEGDAAIRFSIKGDGWTFGEGDTEVVWAYANENEDQGFRHIEVATSEPTRAYVVDFIVELEK